MNKKQIKEISSAFLLYLKQPKTRWDIFDYTTGFIIVFGTLILITWLMVVLINMN